MHGLSLRQAYDYWQDQPGNYLQPGVCAVETANLRVKRLPQLGCSLSHTFFREPSDYSPRPRSKGTRHFLPRLPCGPLHSSCVPFRPAIEPKDARKAHLGRKNPSVRSPVIVGQGPVCTTSIKIPLVTGGDNASGHDSCVSRKLRAKLPTFPSLSSIPSSISLRRLEQGLHV